MKNKKVILSVSAGLLVVIALLSYFLISVSAFAKTDKIIDNTFFYGVDIGGKTKEEAAAIIKEKNNLPNMMPVTLEYEGKSFVFTPAGAGIEYDVEKTVENAFLRGRSGTIIKKIIEVANSDKVKYETPVYKENRETFENTIKTLSEHSGILFENYNVVISENHADITIGKDRKSIDSDKLIKDVYAIMDSEEERKLSLPVIAASPITAEEIYNGIYSEPQNASVASENGKNILNRHKVGILPDMKDIEEGLASGTDKIRIKIEKKYPQINETSFDGQLFNEKLSTYSTKYNKNVVGRSSNVALAARRINGIILNPGEVFSYNDSVGPRTAAAGFSNATVYTSAGQEEGLGGGICQVSSTLYNTALYADMKIVERRNHSYTVSYVKGGLDATVSYGAIDFKFENNKSNPIKIIANAANGVLTVSIMGKKENNNIIELSSSVIETYDFEVQEVPNDTLMPGERKTKQNGSKGCKVVATKIVKDSSGAVIRKESLGTSVYKAMKQIVEVGPVVQDVPVVNDIPSFGATGLPVDAPSEENNIPVTENTSGEEVTTPKPEMSDSGESTVISSEENKPIL